MKKMKQKENKEETTYWFENDDLPANILSRLDAKTLQSLKLVSKKWLNLIIDRSFINLHLKNTARGQPFSGFFFQETYSRSTANDIDLITYIPVEAQGCNRNLRQEVLDFLPESVVLLSSNNGLLCLRSCFDPIPNLYVCNPLNREWVRIEWPEDVQRQSSIAIAFDPLLNPIDSITDFELVAASFTEEQEEEEGHYIFDIYSSKIKQWRRSNEQCFCSHGLAKKNRGIEVDGILYWLTEDGYQILTFDPKEEMACPIMAPLPESQFVSVPEMCIGESKGRLCYAIISEDGLQLWALEDRFECEWELKSLISLDDLERENEGMIYRLFEKVKNGRLSRDEIAWVDPLCFEGDVLLVRVLSKVYEYRFSAKKMKRVCDASELGPRSMFSPIVVPYCMSLVPLA